MSFFKTFMNGEQGLFKANSLTPMQKMVLRFVVVGLVFYAFAVIEGMIMRLYEIGPFDAVSNDQFFAILTAHPLVGIFGSTYATVFGAFLFLVPFLMKKPLWSIKMANWTWILIAVGTLTFWLAGFISHYSPLYTLYWPLPADFEQFSVWGGTIFIAGIAIVMVGSGLFVFNIFKTIMYTPEGWEKQPAGRLLGSALGTSGIANLFRKKDKKREHLVPLPVAAIARGSVDVGLNVLIILFTGVLILVFMVAAIIGADLKDTAVDALLYKNWFWWGLDLIADGLVLIFVAGTWYLLATMITGKKLFMQNIARAALLVELVVSWTVWSHHLLADQSQPAILKVLSGEMVTAFELITQGLAFFIVLATLWAARPLKMTNPLKFLLGGLLGFALAVPAGIMQADVGLNRILHNTQWIVGPHVHVAILIGLTMTLYAAIYVLFPIVTNGAKLYSQKLANIHFWLHLLGGIGMGAFMGMAGLKGMLRRTLYLEGEFETLMILAAVSGAMLLIAFLVFFYNIVMSLGLNGVIGIFQPAKLKTKDLVPQES
ncbi:MAG: cbb3-type cytochrome c oxidase subunit I [Bacteroidetes bacterium]|jgi:cytochrome c oxidase subunit I|nr:cbb3-type cytochrome c oxidase subunit I [Bacteroidota bacterium]MBT3751212.1 cbb3-type cytochrome c oxidase subunit I [Bacteroidota bacterium]MBT4398272.1 cbb3-type cytochrome c oxidase subunit I [Bacteroidota bacterium]MBT4409057.1 cbb3-type cytochrome c oxidase subunit I [Bacteroidota bacterium]MBT7463835.1 cbb3-type cytochrome c oxidase subunit I [Bacteroidota bacterium]